MASVGPCHRSNAAKAVAYPAPDRRARSTAYQYSSRTEPAASRSWAPRREDGCGAFPGGTASIVARIWLRNGKIAAPVQTCQATERSQNERTPINRGAGISVTGTTAAVAGGSKTGILRQRARRVWRDRDDVKPGVAERPIRGYRASPRRQGHRPTDERDPRQTWRGTRLGQHQGRHRRAVEIMPAHLDHRDIVRRARHVLRHGLTPVSSISRAPASRRHNLAPSPPFD